MNNVSFGNIKNTGHDFPQCLSSARHISLEGGAGMWEEIIKELVLSLILWAHLHRAGSWRVSEEPLKCPSPGVSNCSANNSTLAVFEWDTTGQGAWMPSRGTSTQLHPISASARVRACSNTQASGVLAPGKEGPSGFPPARSTSSSGKRNTAREDCPRSLSLMQLA